MSWRISIYLLVLFFVKYRSMIPLMVRFHLSTICAFCSLCVVNSFMLHSGRYVFTKKLKNFVLLSVCITFGRLIMSLKVCSNAFLIGIPYLDLSGSFLTYLGKIIIIINLRPSLWFESLLISNKSICHCSSIRCTTTGLALKLRRTGLCKVYANWDFSHSPTSPIDVFESCFFAS